MLGGQQQVCVAHCDTNAFVVSYLPVPNKLTAKSSCPCLFRTYSISPPFSPSSGVVKKSLDAHQ